MDGWKQYEVEAVITTYLTMMRREGAGEKVVKTHEYRRLHEENTNRSAKAYEFKMQNISAVLALNDLPYITGRTPADAYQNLLEEMLLERLENDPVERAMVLAYGKGLLRQWTQPTVAAQTLEEAPSGARRGRLTPRTPGVLFVRRMTLWGKKLKRCRNLASPGRVCLVYPFK